jgi:hypothetical protein
LLEAESKRQQQQQQRPPPVQQQSPQGQEQQQQQQQEQQDGESGEEGQAGGMMEQQMEELTQEQLEQVGCAFLFTFVFLLCKSVVLVVEPRCASLKAQYHATPLGQCDAFVRMLSVVHTHSCCIYK